MKTENELQTTLEAEVSALMRLSDCVKYELDSLRSHDHHRLAELVTEKQGLLEEVDRLRVTRETLVAAACRTRKASDGSLSALVDSLPDVEAAPIVRLRLDLLRTMKELRRLNVTGRRYVRRHIRFVQEAKAVLSGDETYTAGEYGPSGTTRNATGSGIAVNATV